MAQGKLKVKTKVPEGVKKKKLNKKGAPFIQRSNKPAQRKKSKTNQELTKNLSKIIEEEIRTKAYSSTDKSKFSKAQQVVAQHNSSKISSK